jgi:hypothetical protein
MTALLLPFLMFWKNNLPVCNIKRDIETTYEKQLNKLFFFMLETLPKSSRIPALKKYDMMTFHIFLFQIIINYI